MLANQRKHRIFLNGNKVDDSDDDVSVCMQTLAKRTKQTYVSLYHWFEQIVESIAFF